MDTGRLHLRGGVISPIPTAKRNGFAYLRRHIDLSQMRLLVIGSGADLRGRKMCGTIDPLPANGGMYDRVIRCNKMYGAAEDVGRRTDIAFVRYAEWAERYGLHPTEGTVALNGGMPGGMPPGCYGDWNVKERRALREEMGVIWPSCGALAVYWAILRGCARDNLHVIGFGYNRETGGFAPRKSDINGHEDANPSYDWQAENAWIAANSTLL